MLCSQHLCGLYLVFKMDHLKVEAGSRLHTRCELHMAQTQHQDQLSWMGSLRSLQQHQKQSCVSYIKWETLTIATTTTIISIKPCKMTCCRLTPQSFSISHNLYVFGHPRGNPPTHWENMQTPLRNLRSMRHKCSPLK